MQNSIQVNGCGQCYSHVSDGEDEQEDGGPEQHKIHAGCHLFNNTSVVSSIITQLLHNSMEEHTVGTILPDLFLGHVQWAF